MLTQFHACLFITPLGFHLPQGCSGKVRSVAEQRDAAVPIHLAIPRLAKEQRVLGDRRQVGAAQQLQHVLRPAALRLR